MNRRSFFKFLPVAPLALVAEGAQAIAAKDAPDPDAIVLTLNGSKKRVLSTSSVSNIIIAEYDPNKQVSMTVGQDGKLWIRSKDSEWVRVVTE